MTTEVGVYSKIKMHLMLHSHGAMMYSCGGKGAIIHGDEVLCAKCYLDKKGVKNEHRRGFVSVHK